jgi:hypothetical protein
MQVSQDDTDITVSRQVFISEEQFIKLNCTPTEFDLDYGGRMFAFSTKHLRDCLQEILIHTYQTGLSILSGAHH